MEYDTSITPDEIGSQDDVSSNDSKIGETANDEEGGFEIVLSKSEKKMLKAMTHEEIDNEVTANKEMDNEETESVTLSGDFKTTNEEHRELVNLYTSSDTREAYAVAANVRHLVLDGRLAENEEELKQNEFLTIHVQGKNLIGRKIETAEKDKRFWPEMIIRAFDQVNHFTKTVISYAVAQFLVVERNAGVPEQVKREYRFEIAAIHALAKARRIEPKYLTFKYSITKVCRIIKNFLSVNMIAYDSKPIQVLPNAEERNRIGTRLAMQLTRNQVNSLNRRKVKLTTGFKPHVWENRAYRAKDTDLFTRNVFRLYRSGKLYPNFIEIALCYLSSDWEERLFDGADNIVFKLCNEAGEALKCFELMLAPTAELALNLTNSVLLKTNDSVKIEKLTEFRPNIAVYNLKGKIIKSEALYTRIKEICTVKRKKITDLHFNRKDLKLYVNTGEEFLIDHKPAIAAICQSMIQQPFCIIFNGTASIQNWTYLQTPQSETKPDEMIKEIEKEKVIVKRVKDGIKNIEKGEANITDTLVKQLRGKLDNALKTIEQLKSENRALKNENARKDKEIVRLNTKIEQMVAGISHGISFTYDAESETATENKVLKKKNEFLQNKIDYLLKQNELVQESNQIVMEHIRKHISIVLTISADGIIDYNLN